MTDVAGRGRSMRRTLDDDIDALVRAHGIRDVIAALARQANSMGMATIFRRLSKLHEWLIEGRSPGCGSPVENSGGGAEGQCDRSRRREIEGR